jgi:hypothetical protein
MPSRSRGFCPRTKFIGPALLALAAAATGARAQDAAAQATTPVPPPNAPVQPVEEATKQTPPSTQAIVTLYGEHTFSADLKDSPGSVAIDRAGADLAMRFSVGDRSRLSLDLGSEASWYHFDNATGFASGSTRPWDDTYQLNGTVTFSSQATRQWSWYFGAGADESVESGADWDKGVTGGIFGGVNYGFSEHFSAGLGAVLRSRLEDRALIRPIISLDWQIAEQWRLASHSGVGTSGATLSYKPFETVTFTLDGAWEDREYRLDDDAAAPDGVARDLRIPFSLGATWNITRQVALSGHAGITAYQQYQLLDSDGNKMSEIKTKPAFLAGASLTISF